MKIKLNRYTMTLLEELGWNGEDVYDYVTNQLHIIITERTEKDLARNIWLPKENKIEKYQVSIRLSPTWTVSVYCDDLNEALGSMLFQIDKYYTYNEQTKFYKQL